MDAVSTAKALYRSLRDRLGAFLANDDPLASIANTGAFLVWSNQPFYPLYVWLLVGDAAWPAFLTWLSTPFFYAVAIVGRTHPLGSRILFVVAGILNTLLSTKAFGSATSVGWFLVPCFIIASVYFRVGEWFVALPLSLATLGAALLLPRLGAPLHVYDTAQARSLSHLNLWSVCVLSVVLLVAAIRVRWRRASLTSSTGEAERP